MSSTRDRLMTVNHVGNLSGNVGSEAAMQEYLRSGEQVRFP